MYENIYNILVSFLGDSKQGYYSKDVVQYQFNCPCCADEKGVSSDGKFNLECNFALGKYHCWSCGETHGTKGKISRLIKKWGGESLARAYFEEIKTIKSSQLYKLDAFDDIEIIFEETDLKLPKTFTKINLSKCRNKKLKEYLIKRRITQDIIDKFNIGYTTWDEEKPSLRNRIIIPSYDSIGELNYWVGRDFTGCDKRMKYMNADCDKKQIIFNESLINWDADIFLCEGIIDSIVIPNGIPLMGKQLLSDSVLFQTLYKKANANIIITLDADTEIKETKRIYSLLNNGRLRNKIKYIRLDKYKDFGEIHEMFGKKGIIQTLTYSNKFSEIDLLI